MGVLNVTPDSFSDGGRFLRPRDAIDRARRLVSEGAAIVWFVKIQGALNRYWDGKAAPNAAPVPSV